MVLSLDTLMHFAFPWSPAIDNLICEKNYGYRDATTFSEAKMYTAHYHSFQTLLSKVMSLPLSETRRAGLEIELWLKYDETVQFHKDSILLEIEENADSGIEDSGENADSGIEDSGETADSENSGGTSIMLRI